MFRFYSALWVVSLLKPEMRDMRFPPGTPMMLAGSDGVHFFLYEREPASGLDILLASNCAEFMASVVRGNLAAALGIAPPGQRGQGAVVTGEKEIVAGQPPSRTWGLEKVQRRIGPDNFMGCPATFNLPETPASQAAASWLRMLNQSDVKAMRSYIRNAMGPAPMNDLALDERLESYRKLHVRLGFLRPAGVQASAPYEITLVFRSVHHNRWYSSLPSNRKSRSVCSPRKLGSREDWIRLAKRQR